MYEQIAKLSPQLAERVTTETASAGNEEEAESITDDIVGKKMLKTENPVKIVTEGVKSFFKDLRSNLGRSKRIIKSAVAEFFLYTDDVDMDEDYHA